MTSTKPYLRKKAVLIMYKVFLKFPEALRPAFPRLKEKLEDPDTGEIMLTLQFTLLGAIIDAHSHLALSGHHPVKNRKILIQVRLC